MAYPAVALSFALADCSLPHKVLAFNHLLYVSHLLTPYTRARSLCSQDKHLFTVPTVSTIIGSQGFSYASLSIWNEIPVEIHNSPSLTSFKKEFKTHYFSHTFP